MKTAVIFSIVLGWGMIVVNPAQAQIDPSGLWTDVAASSIGTPPRLDPLPVQLRTLRLDLDALLALLAQSPLERSPEAANANVVLHLPLPDGAFGRFRIVESPVMAPALATKFPQIKTYAGQGLDDPTATVRLDWTPHGFHAMILSANGAVFIDPYSRGDVLHYLSYFKRDARRGSVAPPNDPDVIDNSGVGDRIAALVAQGAVAPSGTELRTYRTVVAATGEYTQFHGGTVPDGMAAIVTAMNRVDGVYERDVAVRMVLVANNELVVYTNGATDPYTNNNGVTMLGENQANLDMVIGDANYDVGHVFSTGGGGVAFLGVPCVTGDKAGGVTGLSSPIGDPFYIDYVAHEMGHQFGGNHTFNGTSGSCSGQRNPSTAYEPGSGTTIMAYAGICGSQDIQEHSDDHFHVASFDEIAAYTTLDHGNDCPDITATGNDAPLPDAGTDGFTIPLSTPFSLIGSAIDPNGDPMTYNWEQFDLGPAGHPNAPVGNAPLFRSFPSQTIPERTFPQLSDIVNNTQTIGEILPYYERSMTFRLTVRDNRAGGGGVDHDELSFDVTDEAGPFLVTGPNTAVTWTGNTQETVTWDVANTDNAPVSASTVNVRLSTDGGFTYPITLATGTANDGTEMITVPNLSAMTARVKVEAAGNVFFDISNADFTISPGAGPLTRYVATMGSDAANDCGNPSNPCATLGHAADQANDGDIINVMAGTYNEPGLLIEKELYVEAEGVIVQ